MLLMRLFFIMILWQLLFKFIWCIIFRLPWVMVHHDYIGLRSYQVSPFTSVQRVKQLLYEETHLPVEEQRLSHNGRRVSWFIWTRIRRASSVSVVFVPALRGHYMLSGVLTRVAEVFSVLSCPPDAFVASELQCFGWLHRCSSRHDWNWSPDGEHQMVVGAQRHPRYAHMQK